MSCLWFESGEARLAEVAVPVLLVVAVLVAVEAVGPAEVAVPALVVMAVLVS